LLLFIAALDATIVATAAPTISRDLNSAAGYTWVGAAYLIMNAVAGPIWAKLSDIWGRKLIILVTLALFFASSAASAAAQTMRALIVGRAFQGAAGGGFILLVHVCISDMFSLRQRSLLMGLTEGIWALAGGIGPVLGGVFASFGVWRWCCKSFFFSLRYELRN
jgi:MFS family permease